MARPLRIQYPGAIYHVMARGDGGRNVFDDDDDRISWINLLGKSCERFKWRVHAYVLMGNHFHLLVETPDSNLVEGMRWLMGVFAQGWNRRRERRGHVFQGRYKAVIVEGEDKSEGYFRVVADYIHLNPVRIGWVGGDTGQRLANYRWSSFPCYGRKKAPSWLETRRVIEEYGLSKNKRGARSYTNDLEARSLERETVESDASNKVLRRGWCIGSHEFKQRVLKRLPAARKARPENVNGEAARDRDSVDAEAITRRALRSMGLPANSKELTGWGKFIKEKDLIIAVLRQYSSASNAWIAERLGIGHSSRIPIAAKRVRESKPLSKELTKLVENIKIKD